MKTLQLNICKRLQEAGMLNNINTDYYHINWRIINCDEYNKLTYWKSKLIEQQVMWWVKFICDNCWEELSFKWFEWKCNCSNWETWLFCPIWKSNLYLENDFIKAPNLEESIELLKKISNPKNWHQDLYEAYLQTWYKWWSIIEMFFELADLDKIDTLLNYLLDNPNKYLLNLIK